MKRLLATLIAFGGILAAGMTASADAGITRTNCPVGMPAGNTCSADGSQVITPANWLIDYGPSTACAVLHSFQQYGVGQPAPANDTARAHCVGDQLVQPAPTVKKVRHVKHWHHMWHWVRWHGHYYRVWHWVWR